MIGVIHGDEDAGSAILDDLRSEPVPDGVELWVVDSMNPDGQAAQVRQNANGVDLNRNFPDSWGPIGVPGDSRVRRYGTGQRARDAGHREPGRPAPPRHHDLVPPGPVRDQPGEGSRRSDQAALRRVDQLADGRDLGRHLHRHRRDVGPPRSSPTRMVWRSSSNWARRCRPRMPHCTPTPSAPSASKAETPGVRHRAFHVQTKRANTSSGSRSETSELIGWSRSACPIATPQKIRCSSGAPTNSLTAASCTAQASCGHVSRPAS